MKATIKVASDEKVVVPVPFWFVDCGSPPEDLFDVYITKIGPDKLRSASLIRRMFDLAPKDALALVSVLPARIFEHRTRAEGQYLIDLLENDGIRIELFCCGPVV